MGGLLQKWQDFITFRDFSMQLCAQKYKAA